MRTRTCASNLRSTFASSYLRPGALRIGGSMNTCVEHTGGIIPRSKISSRSTKR